VDVVNKMMANPESKKLVLKARKLSDPTAVLPEYDAQAATENALAVERERLAALEKRMADRDAMEETRSRTAEFTRAWNKQKSALTRQGYTDEGIEAIEKHAQ